MTCLYCGKEFETSRLNARYCDDICKANAKKERNKSTPHKSVTNADNMRVCANCGVSIEHLNFRARYCGQPCKQESYRRRKERKAVIAQ